MPLTGPKFAVDLLAFLQPWAAWIWTGSAAFGCAILVVLYRQVRGGRRRLAWRDLDDDDGFLRLLVFFERFIATSFSFLVLLIAVGVASKIAPTNALVGIGTLLILLGVPPFITWIAFRGVRLRVMER